MKKILFLASVAVVLSACDSAPTSNSVEDTASAPVSTEFYAARPTQYSWPAADQASTQFSPSLLAQNYYLVIDGSGSMVETGCSDGQRKIDVAKSAVDQFIQSIPKDANIGLLVFDHYGISERAPLGSDRQQLRNQVQRIAANGATPLHTAITAAYKAITLQAQKQYGYGEYHLVVVTDGEAVPGEDPGRIVGKINRESPVVITTIGFCIGSGHSLNRPGITQYSAANNPQELLAGLKTVLAEANEYVVDHFDEAAVSP
jgi:Ca-activated chloride channel homolog